MDKSECSICDNAFDDANHRPRNFPCGHGACSECIENCISRGKRRCPFCNKKHKANSSTDLPVSFLLEEFLHKASTSTAQQHEVDSLHDDGNIIMCSKHKGIPLYFMCKSHDVKVCHSCVVIDHPSALCNLVSLEDEMIEKKQSQIKTVQRQKHIVTIIEKNLNSKLKMNINYLSEQNNKKGESEKEVELLLSKIEKINKDIVNKEKEQDQLKEEIKNSKEKLKLIIEIENRLRPAESYQDIEKQYENAAIEILQIQKWGKTLETKLLLCKIPREIRCKNWLETVLKLAHEEEAPMAHNVSQLIQGLIDARIDPEVFTEDIQKELKRSIPESLATSLKQTLPQLRLSLARGELTIDGVKSPTLNDVPPARGITNIFTCKCGYIVSNNLNYPTTGTCAISALGTSVTQPSTSTSGVPNSSTQAPTSILTQTVLQQEQQPTQQSIPVASRTEKS